MVDYEKDEKWADVVPIPQNDGGPNPLAAIAYTDEYDQAMSYLRAVMANNEKSLRILDITDHIIHMNPAHYTVWSVHPIAKPPATDPASRLYRAATIKELSLDPLEELTWLNKISLKILKNYQIWGHRQVIMKLISELPQTELPFLARVLAKDTKNYHVWSYRQWLVQHFSLWPTKDNPGHELKFTESLLTTDVRNNSAWNHRFFVLFGREDGEPTKDSIFEREIEFAKEKISEGPQNQSPWNYIKGVIRRQGKGEAILEQFAGQFADVDNEDEIRSSHALDLLATIWADGQEIKAVKALDLLGERFDPIRKNYWEYRKGLLQAKAGT